MDMRDRRDGVERRPLLVIARPCRRVSAELLDKIHQLFR